MYDEFYTTQYALDGAFALAERQLRTIDNVFEVVAAINRHGLQDSIKDLFGHDLAELSPAYAAGKDTAIVMAELNVACEGLVETVKDILNKIWDAITKFVHEMVYKLGLGITRLRKLLKSLVGVEFEADIYKKHMEESHVPLTKHQVEAFFEATPSTMLVDHFDKIINVLADVPTVSSVFGRFHVEEDYKTVYKSHSKLFKIIGFEITDKPSDSTELAIAGHDSDRLHGEDMHSMSLSKAGFSTPKIDRDWLLSYGWKLANSEEVFGKCEAALQRAKRHYDSKLYKLVDVNASPAEIEQGKRAGIRALRNAKRFTDLYFNYLRLCAMTIGRLAGALTAAATHPAHV